MVVTLNIRLALERSNHHAEYLLQMNADFVSGKHSNGFFFRTAIKYKF